ncbi:MULTISPECIES: hypothetical protein [Mesorhizobium]|uniref:hypothetical protein n=1 Tax=Mesorhizobium TaxID=68287 RepID=UPI0010C0A6A8|nr:MULTISPECIES: hypothetical protein [Mesorhizobium]
MKINIPEHLKDRFVALDNIKYSEPPLPWKKIGILSVGGLTDVGFAHSSELLIIVSASGRGLLDCRKGTFIARDTDENFEFDIGNLEVEGIGPLQGQKIRTNGLYGGGLSTSTSDGWRIERHPLSWPDEELFLSSQWQTMLWTKPGKKIEITKLGDFITEVRAFGFSPNGMILIIATSSDIAIYGR